MTRTIVALLAGAAVAAAVPAQAQDEARVFTRSGQWTLDAGEDSCRLARVFTNGDQQIALALERNRAENLARLVLVSNALTVFRGAEELGYRFLPAGEQRTARFLRSETADRQTYLNLGNVLFGQLVMPEPGGVFPPYDRAAEQEFAAGLTGIEINSGLGGTVRIETGSLRGAMQALQACTDDLLRAWGLDWEKHQTMTRRVAPVGNAWEWIPNGVVGFADFASFGGGQNPFRVMVSAEGQPTACTVHWASLDEGKNRRICDAIMENGSFTPALDADGQPMASYWMVDYVFGLSRPFGR